jgi:FkbM family methyltransferase
VITREPLPAAPSEQFRRRPFLEAAGERFRNAPIAPAARAWLRRAYHAVLMLQTGGRGLRSTLPHGEVVRALPKYRYLSWNPTEYSAFREALETLETLKALDPTETKRPGVTALDVGANVGAYSILLGQWAGPSGKVFAFEPAPEVFEGLARHVALNGLAGRVEPIRSAVGAEVGTARLLIAGTGGESRLVIPTPGTPGTDVGAMIDVRVTTIDAFCAERGLSPDFIKVDVEGFELSVLQGARDTIRRRGRDLALFVEMHPSVWPVLGLSKGDILAELHAQSLTIVPLQPTDDVWAVEGLCVRLRHC